ncbi:GntR family transcriptional regulator [Pigmentiphaga sp. NML080357]|uniref:GntR family transcriptional regulator n=1 Tax=Pigmentiphaga sp. NML080357 TaxID=2008675 RepID=UPI000B40A6B5|nr:GntR family transcriptional regulator [Pigmentiphaga sp. NML080357]OVZ64979.1 GntR family transcriptional regulator [Pigmentiphaga sp. NML080357]
MPRQKAAPAAPSAKNLGQSACSRGEQAYQYVRTAIRSGELAPGTRLREIELAELLGLSRTPVREALSRLESEGLVVNESGRGLVVTELDQSMINELYVMREVLEGTAARLAARHASDVEISALREIADRDAQLLEQPDQLAVNNHFFHETLYRCAHNRYLLKTLNSLQESMSLLGPTTLAMPGRAQSSSREHQEMVAALEQRDPDLAERITREHIRAAYKVRLTRMLRNI